MYARRPGDSGEFAAKGKGKSCIKEPAECKELLIESIKEQMEVGETAYEFENEKIRSYW